MKCTYKIYNGKNEEGEGKDVMEFTVPCFTKGTEGDTNWNEELLLKAFEEWNRSTYFPDGNSEGDTFAF